MVGVLISKITTIVPVLVLIVVLSLFVLAWRVDDFPGDFIWKKINASMNVSDRLNFIPSNTAVLFQKANISSSIHSDCVVFSCSPPDYSLVPAHWNASTTTRCDRYHFWGTVRRRVLKPFNITVAPHWCRVALLDDPNGILTHYSTIAYVDVDVVFNEKAFLHAAETHSNATWIMTAKIEQGKDTLRTSSFVIPSRKRALAWIHEWAAHWQNAALQDQTVWNKLHACPSNGTTDDLSLNGLVCYFNAQVFGEVRHCGSWLSESQRIHCLRTPTQ